MSTAELYRDFGAHPAMIDRGGPAPLPPSVFSALVRERATGLARSAVREEHLGLWRAVDTAAAAVKNVVRR
ncbi:hypothetical protein EDC02_5954 [Micromonospora sp. Llam0]|uniref:hypothetical protein n=1 Tax=Micromonospora sp. Llam0 TaxID=2485143 RepID=UPI000F470A4D|nr:hypothetical protein [Micromonospora sp. Llam0]ROO51090.1 hypothetical protein EDC02_5954 [Micromonospora sp. Llam0]